MGSCSTSLEAPSDLHPKSQAKHQKPEVFDPNISKTSRYLWETENIKTFFVFSCRFHCAVARIWSLLMQRHASMKWRCECSLEVETQLICQQNHLLFDVGEPDNILISSHYTCRILYYCSLEEYDWCPGFLTNTVRLGMVFIYVQAEMASLAAPFYFISQMLGEVGVLETAMYGSRKVSWIEIWLTYVTNYVVFALVENR